MQLTRELRTATDETDAKAGSYNSQGTKALNNRQWEEAANAYSKAIKKDPNSAQSYLGRGVAEWYLAQNKNIFYTPQAAYQSAIADFTKAIELGQGDKISLDAHYNLGLIYQKQGEFLKSARHLQVASTGAPENQYYQEAYGELAPKLMEFGKNLLKEGKIEESAECFETANSLLHSAQTENWQAKAHLALAKAKLAEADRLYLKSANQSLAGKKNEAEETSKKARETEELALIELQKADKHFHEARKLDKKSTEKKDNAECNYLIGARYQNAGDNEKALEHYTMAVAWDDQTKYRQARAGVYASMGTQEETLLAEKDLREALKEEPSSTRLHLELAIVLQNNKQYEEAFEHLKKALHYSQIHEPPLRSEEKQIKKRLGELGYEMVDEAYAAREKGEIDWAYKLADLGISAVKKSGSENPQAYYARALMSQARAENFERQGDWKRAAGAYEDALHDHEKFASLATEHSAIVLANAHQRLGIAYQKIGRLQDADRQFVKAIENEQNENYVRNRISLSRDYAERGTRKRKENVAGAEDDYFRAIATDASYFNPFNGLAVGLYSQVRNSIAASALVMTEKADKYIQEARGLLIERIGGGIAQRSDLEGQGLKLHTSASVIELNERELAVLRIAKSVKKDNYLISYEPSQTEGGEIEIFVGRKKDAIENALGKGLSGRFEEMFESLSVADRALLCMNMAILLEPDRPENYYNRGMLMLQAKDWERAALDLQIAVELSTNVFGRENITARDKLAEAYMQLGQLESAQEQLQICQMAGPDMHASWVSSYEYRLAQIEKTYAQNGQKYFRDGQIDEAMVYFRHAMDMNPKNGEYAKNYSYCIDAVFEQAVRQFENGNLAWARDKFESIRQLEPQNTRTYEYLGNIAYSLAEQAFITGDYAVATAWYDEAIAWGANDAQMRYHKGLCFARSDNMAGALEEYNLAIELKPDFAEAYIERGRARKETEPKAALDDFETAIRLLKGKDAPAEIRLEAGLLAQQLHMHKRAISHFTYALQNTELTESMQADLNLRLGRSHMALRNSKEGAKHLDAALEYYQKFDGQYAKEQGEAHLLRAHARINLGRYDEAGLDIDRLIWLQPKNAESYALRAIVRAKKKDYADAFADVDIALEMQPSLSTAYQARAAVRYEMLYAPAAEVGLNNNSALMNALRTNGIDIQNEKNAAMYALFTKKELDEIMLFDNNLGAYRLGRENNNIRLDALAANDELDRLYKTQKKKDNGNTFYTSILLDYEKALQLDYNNQDARTGLENMRRFAPITGLDPELMGNAKAIAGVETIPASQKTQPIRVMAAYWPSIRNTEDIIENMRGRITFEDRALRTYEYHTDKDLTNQDWAEIAQKAKDGKKYSYNASERTVALQVGQAFWGQYLTRSIVPWYVPLSVNLYETQGRVAVYDGYGYGPYQIISKPTQESQGMRELNHNIRELGGNSLKVLPEVGKDYGFRSYKTYVPHVYNLFTRMQNYTNHKTTPSTFAPTAKGYEAIRTVAVGYNSADGKEQYGQIVSLTCKYLFTKSQEYNKDALAPPSAPALVAQMHQKLGSPPLEIEMHETEIAEKEVGSKTAAPAPTMTSGQAYAMFEENGKCLGVIIDPKQTRVSILKLKNAKALDGAVAIAQDNAHASKEQAIAVVTPSYYETSKVPTYEVTINETVIANGVKTSPWTLWVGTDGIAHIEQTSDFMLRQPNRTSRPEVAFAIGSKPLKIDNGEKIEARDLTSDGNRDRTLAALTDDGRLIFATFNASKKGGKSNWMTYDKAADMLMEQAEKNGVKIDKMLFLDGGGSTKLWVGGETPKSYEGSEGKESKRRLNFYITVYTNEGQE